MRSRAKIVAGGLGAGLLLAAALPPWGWWPLAFAGLVGLDLLIADRSRGTRFRRGMLVGLGLYFPSMLWMMDLTPPGYVIASVAYAALLGGAMCLVPASAPGRWLALPGAVGVTEILRWSFPFGGVPLSSLAVGQVAGPLAPVLRVGGAILLVQVTVIVGVALAATLRRSWVAAGVAGGLTVVLLVGAALAPHGSATGEEINIALVQGGGEQGTRARDTDMREVFERHRDASDAIDTPVDLVVWPENVVDVEGDILDNVEGEELADLARELDAPVVVGITAGDGPDDFHNYSAVFEADGSLGERYDKVHRVPFGEYVPLRSVVEPFAGDQLTGREAVIGEEPAELTTAEGHHMAVAISWEIFFGDRAREGVRNNAELVINPTNGSSYRGTMVQTQQVATSRMRAIENGRWVLQVAPTGFTAVVDDDGNVLQRSSVSEQVVLQDTVELRDGRTLYTRLGLVPGWLLALASLASGWAVSLLARRRAGSGGDGSGDAGMSGSEGDEAAVSSMSSAHSEQGIGDDADEEGATGTGTTVPETEPAPGAS